MPPNLMPRQAEKRIHALQRLSSRLRHEEPHPRQTNEADACTEREESVRVHVQQHCWDGLRVAELVDEVEAHDEGAAESS